MISVDGHWEAEVLHWAGIGNTKIIYHRGVSGIFSNINYALNYVSGDLVQLFCQDDRMYPGYLQRQVDILANNQEVAMVFSSFDVIDDSGRNINDKVQFTFRPNQDKRIKPSEAPELFIEYGCLPGNISPVMLRRNLFSSVGLFDVNMPYAGDFDYWVRISKDWELHYLHIPGLQVRRHDKQASMTMSNRQLFLDLVHIYRALLELVPKENIQAKIHHINRKIGSAFMHHSWISVLKGRSHIRTLAQRWKDMQQYPFNAFWASTYYGISIPSRIIGRISR
jgi:glycosyltransferase involved in cell wall biosynthesis